MRSYRLGLLLPFVILGLTYACSGSDDSASQSGAVLDPSCKSDTANPPHTLLCTGLYKDIKAKTINAGIEAYTPATPLWSDGADKSRWIQLPPGKTIDRSDPNEWKFPVGTSAWKEFKVNGKRVETRLWRKVSDTSWVNATYAWNDDESSATVSAGGDVPAPGGGGTYHIPTNDECNECHRGRHDRLLGFEEVSLGLDGAQGVTLATLATDKKLSPPPTNTSLSIGDDGTNGANIPAMRWLHVNCGVACHNTDPNAFANSVGMDLRLDPTTLTGGSSAGFQDHVTTLNVPVKAPSFAGQDRISPGDPDNSVIYERISRRGDGQMPPIASNVVDDDDVAAVKAWIAALGPAPAGDDDDLDAGTPDAGKKKENDGGDTVVDSGTPDTGAPVDAGDTNEPTDAGALCQAGSVQETEQNDSAASADVMTSGAGSFCGRLTPGDNDYFEWVMPANTKTWSISDSTKGGAVTVTGTVNGQTFTLNSGGAYPFFPGMTYVFHASSTANTNVDYSVAITITQ